MWMSDFECCLQSVTWQYEWVNWEAMWMSAIGRQCEWVTHSYCHVTLWRQHWMSHSFTYEWVILEGNVKEWLWVLPPLIHIATCQVWQCDWVIATHMSFTLPSWQLPSECCRESCTHTRCHVWVLHPLIHIATCDYHRRKQTHTHTHTPPPPHSYSLYFSFSLSFSHMHTHTGVHAMGGGNRAAKGRTTQCFQIRCHSVWLHSNSRGAWRCVKWHEGLILIFVLTCIGLFCRSLFIGLNVSTLDDIPYGYTPILVGHEDVWNGTKVWNI